jgi:hypothetical protein
VLGVVAVVDRSPQQIDRRQSGDVATFKVRGDVIDLTFKVKVQSTPLEVQAKHLLLAMPRRSLELLSTPLGRRGR